MSLIMKLTEFITLVAERFAFKGYGIRIAATVYPCVIVRGRDIKYRDKTLVPNLTISRGKTLKSREISFAYISNNNYPRTKVISACNSLVSQLINDTSFI